MKRLIQRVAALTAALCVAAACVFICGTAVVWTFACGIGPKSSAAVVLPVNGSPSLVFWTLFSPHPTPLFPFVLYGKKFKETLP